VTLKPGLGVTQKSDSVSSQARFYATHRWATALGCSWGRQTAQTVTIFRPVSKTYHISCRRSDWRTLLTSTPTLNCFIGQLDQFWVDHSHMKGNTEITNCHHKHYMGDKKRKNLQKSGGSNKIVPLAQWRRNVSQWDGSSRDGS